MNPSDPDEPSETPHAEVVDARVGHEGTRIDLDHVTKRYVVGDREVAALDDLSLHVDEAATSRRCTALIG